MSEIVGAPYGGSNDADNSGSLRYVRIQYSGLALDSEHEANGLSLYGVGNGTKISYVQILDGSDDGIEFFGGSANIDHCVVENCTDDSFDWTEGWNGTAEYIVAYQTVAECDCLMECDNNGDNNDATPVAHPTIRYATFVGNNSSDNKRGLRFREGTQVTLEYALVTGKPSPVTLETSQTVASFDNGTSSIKNTYISGTLVNEEGTGYDNSDFVAAGNTANYSGFNFTSGFVGKVVAAKPFKLPHLAVGRHQVEGISPAVCRGGGSTLRSVELHTPVTGSYVDTRYSQPVAAAIGLPRLAQRV